MLGFSESLKRKKATGLVPVIPDIKIRSPKEGDLFHGRSPVDAARLMERIGAPAISVVTESRNFGGSMRLLEDVVSGVSVPVLRKDFIQDEDDVRRTRDSGAAAILLICACLPEQRMRRLYDAAIRLSLEPLVEVHTGEEMELARRLGAKLIGINNRDILALEKDDGSVSTTQALAVSAPGDALLISESGIETPEQARAAIRAGAGAVLVGTAIWKARMPGEFYRSLCGEKN
ncbi:MAG: indole-3-glycerol-phosphate synthase [Bacillota bacterium]